ncbi:SPW repeat protein [Dactylosporangium sp. AC04546]|uniref:SPW repeat protein n=1 Tax=Dactylosporangium sp. AC04546 TaxID=2862460 RepID=UPI001EDF459A|nr:SPW repeat protein [Dactylosporangium sp. AC04546]WVK89331.1 SPW repeat protein [Dactylosporangium sp. AC04546]
MVRPVTDLEGHPDIVELRERYDRASAAPTGYIAEGLLLLTGVYLAISPWVVNFAGAQPNLAVNNLICGVAVAFLALAFATAYGRTHGLAFVPVVLGVWTFIAPWVIGGAYATGGSIANNIVVGVIMFALGLVMLRLPGIGSPRVRR